MAVYRDHHWPVVLGRATLASVMTVRHVTCLVVLSMVTGIATGVRDAYADDPDTAVTAPNPRRHRGTRIAKVGLGATLTGIAVGSFAIGLGNDRPDAARPFYYVAGVSLGAGVLGLATGLYLRATSPVDPPDAIARDPVRSRHRAERRAGVAIGGLGAAAVITGIAHAIGAIYDDRLADRRCADGVCGPDGDRLRARSHTMALAAYMLTGMGAIGIAGGVILYRGGRDAVVTPVVGMHSVGAGISGSF